MGYKITFDQSKQGVPFVVGQNELIFAENDGFKAHVNGVEIPISVGQTYVDNKVNSVTISGALIYRGSVANQAVLSSLTPALGDYYQTEDTGIFYLYNGTDWIETSSLTDLTNYYTKAEVDSKVVAGGGGGITDAPQDGSQYARQDGGWTVVTPPPGKVDSVNGYEGEVVLTAADLGLGTVMQFKGQVADEAALNAMTGQAIGDTYQTEDTNNLWAWTASGWVNLGTADIDLSNYFTMDQTNAAIDSKIATLAVSGSVTPNNNTRSNVSSLFSIAPYVQDFQVWYDDDRSGNPQIVIRAQRLLTDTGDLTITAPLGMGSYVAFDTTNPKIVFGVATDGSAFGMYPITITEEAANAPTTITVPENVKSFEISYFVRSTLQSSYWVDLNGVAYSFNISNTPITNFAVDRSGNENGTYTINGLSVVKKNISEICFGDDYKTVTSVGNYFLNYLYGLKKANFGGLTNIASVGAYFLSDSQAQVLDLRPFSNLRTAATYYMCSGNRMLQDVDISTWSNVTTGAYPFSYCPAVTMIRCGGLDVSVGNWQAAYNFYQCKNDTSVTRIHDTQDLANKWNTRFPSMNKQTIVIDPTRGGTI